MGDELTLEAGAAWNHSELVRQAPLYWADGAPVDFSSMQTSTGQRITNPAGLLGSPLAGSPPLQTRFGVRFETTIGTLDAAARVGVAHQSHSLATTDQMSLDLQGQSTAYDLPAFTTVNAAFAVGRGDWTVQLLGENLTDTRAVLYANYALYYRAATVNRPRTIGLRLTYHGGRAEARP